MATLQQRFGQRVRYFRESREWKQDDLSRASGIDRGYLQHIEAGRKNVTLETIRRLARALRCRMAELMPDWE